MKKFKQLLLATTISLTTVLPVLAQNDIEQNETKEVKKESYLGGKNINAFSRKKIEAENENEEEEKESYSQKSLGGRNISAYTRNLGNTVVGGYFDTEFYMPDGKNSYFDQHRLILQASSYFNDRMFFNTEIEFEHGGLINTGLNDGEIKIEQLYLDYQIEEWLIFRSGVVLIPLGRLNVLHDSDFRDTTARPLFTRVIMPSTWMEPGAGFYGVTYPNDDWEINYEAYVTQGIRDGIRDGNGLRGARPSLSADNNSGKAVSTRVGFSPFLGFEFGTGAYYSHFDEDNKKDIGLFVGDFNYSNGPFELLGEGGFAIFDPVDVKDETGNITSTLDGSMWGYYLEAHYHLFPEFLKMSFLGEDFDNPIFTLFSRIDQVDTDTKNLNKNDRTQLAFGLNYRPTTNVVFKIEYQWNIENEAILKGDPSKEIANNQLIASVAAGF